MKYQIEGVINQTLSFELDQGESCWASKGSIVSYDDTIDWTLKIPGGMGKTVSRMLSGESLTLTHCTAKSAGRINFASRSPGKVVVWNLGQAGDLVALRGGFLAAVGEIDISVTMARRAGAMFFGGGGLLLQHLKGNGLAFLSVAGDLVEYDLKPGESILVSTGNLAAFQATVDYSVTSVGGCLKMIFGGEGVFMTKLTGPGKVFVQSLKRVLQAKAARGES